jgi:Predicted integral membrane protein
MVRRRLIIFSAIVVGAMLVLDASAWIALPADAQVPIHWGPDGQVDGYASKTVGLLLLPLVTLGVATLLWVIPLIEPRRANIEKSGKAYAAIWVSVVLLMAAIDVVAVAAALGADLDMTLIVFVATGALFIVIGNYLPKVRPNYLMGIRTPWTLTSDLAWDRTHRVGGRAFVLEGLAFILVGLVRPSPETLVVVLIGGIAIMLVFVVAYSYRVWQTDPLKRQA